VPGGLVEALGSQLDLVRSHTPPSYVRFENRSALPVTAQLSGPLADASKGASVDVSVDAYPKAAVTGVVRSIQDSVASTFTYLPPPGSADPSNPTRVDQYVPVRIALTSTDGAQLRPGMNVTVHIHKT